MPRQLNRQYTNIKTSEARFFIGQEVERTMYYQHRTLFVIGVQSAQEIISLQQQHDCTHIFFGANYSFEPRTQAEEEQWQHMLGQVLKHKIPMSIDTTIKYLGILKDFALHKHFCIQIRLPIADVEAIKDNCYLKVDDVGFKRTNTGIWTTSISKITKPENYTDWNEYGGDMAIL